MTQMDLKLAALHADVKSVMIFGESAGAGSVTNHLVHQRSFPFFTRAAMESGPFADWAAQNLSVAERVLNFRLFFISTHAQISRGRKRLAVAGGLPRTCWVTTR